MKFINKLNYIKLGSFYNFILYNSNVLNSNKCSLCRFKIYCHLWIILRTILVIMVSFFSLIEFGISKFQKHLHAYLYIFILYIVIENILCTQIILYQKYDINWSSFQCCLTLVSVYDMSLQNTFIDKVKRMKANVKGVLMVSQNILQWIESIGGNENLKAIANI